MTQLAILTPAERRRFDRPPDLSNDERRLYFNVTPDVRAAIARIEQPSNQAGFLLQLGYFRASARFYGTTAFKRRDVAYVQRVLKLESIDLDRYTATVMRRHRQTIRALLNWRAVDDAVREALAALADRYVANQEYPKRIFFGLIDLCWKRQWVIPAYHELADIITRSFNAVDQELLNSVEHALKPEHVEKLEALLQTTGSVTGSRSAVPITVLKNIDQSLKPGDIKASLECLALFRDHFMALRDAIDVLPLSDKATEYYATWLAKADHQQLAQFTSRHKVYLHLLAFIKHQFYSRQDAAIDVLLKAVTATRNAIKAQLLKRDQASKTERNLAIQALRQAHLSASAFANGVVAITRAAQATPSEKYDKIATLADEYLAGEDPDALARIEALDADIRNELKNVAYYELLASLSVKLQRRVADVVRTVIFDTETSDADLMAAIEHFKVTDGRLGAHPPCEFLSKQEREAVHGDGTIATPLYKALLFLHMADGIKSAHLNLHRSYRYRAIQDYLIPQSEWEADKANILKETGLSDYADGAHMLATLKGALDDAYRTTNENYLAGQNPYMSIDAKGRCRVRTPRTDYDERKYIASTLSQDGIVPILPLLRSINRVCQFTVAFKHFSTKHGKMKPSEEMLIAGVLAKGCNIGLGKLTKISTGLPEHVLQNTVNWYFDIDNIRAANRKIVDVISRLALANNYVHQLPVIHSSSDGRKMSVAVDCLHANYSFKYFGKDKGVTDYTFIDERHALFHSQVFSASDREAPYVIDGLLDNGVPLGQIHSTDTHGFTEQVFGATHLLGIAFAPRIKNIHRQCIYGFSARQTYKKKGYVMVPSRTINQKLILRHWDDVLRFIATIKTRRVTASQLFKRLSSYAKEHPLYQALKEFGRIIKSQFVLTYYDDVELRQQIQKQLNRVEQANKFSAAVFFDNDQAFQDGTLQYQESATACKLLLQNAIILWNYLSLSERIINTPDPEERLQLIATIGRGSVIVRL